MEQNSRNILFIDDHCDQYISNLDIAAQASGFKLFACDNVIEGLNFLNDYSVAVDAVILDLSFPNGEMQGIEALQIIKKKHQHIPVIMLTDSDTSADLERVVDCMKKGAYNYVGKKTLNPVYLFQLVDNALQQSQLVSYTNAANKSTNKSDTFFTVTQEYVYGRFSKRALFGFELSSVSKPLDENDALRLKTNAISWHENLLKSISTPFRDTLQLNLKFIAEKNSIKCRIIFTVYGEDDEKLKQRIADTQYDIKTFFIFNNGDKNNPFLFESISNEQILRNVPEFSPDFHYNLFFRTPLKIGHVGSSTIGFNTPQNKEDDKIKIFQPDEFFPISGELVFDNELFRVLNAQQHYTEIDVQLVPKSLMIEEVEVLRQVAKNQMLIVESQYTQKETERFSDYLNKFIATNYDKFLISILLKSDSELEQLHLKSAIQRYFFGQLHAQSSRREAIKINRFQTDTEGNFNQLPFFYSLQEAIQAFRLPFPDTNMIIGINSQPLSFNQIPKNLPTKGILLGEKKTNNEILPIRINEEALARHLYIMGQTGTGKSTLLKTMIADCLQKNYGFALIDPHGDLFDEVLKLIPKAKKNKLVVLNTTDPENSAKHNPIGYDENNPQSKSLVINELIRIFSSIYDMRNAGGPMFELYLKNGLLLVMDEKVQEKYKQATILDFVKLFFDKEYRNKLIELCGNKYIVDFFNVAERNSGDWSFNNFATYITSKLTRFTEDFYLTPIITAKEGNINFRNLIDEGNILLVKMDKGLIGSDNVSLLGQMLVSSLVLATMSRTDSEKTKRKPFYLFVDEFQNFIRGDIGTALSEVRKYGLSLTLANQTLGQLEQSTVEALMGNVGSMIFFRPGINDYEKVKYYLEPEFNRRDVLKLPNFNCISRLLIDNIPCEPFVFQNIYE